LALWATPLSTSYLEYFLAICLMGFSFFGTHSNPDQVAQWIYLVPLYLFLLFDYRLAKVINILYGFTICTIIAVFVYCEFKMQFLSTYVLCSSLSFAFAMFNERKSQRLATQVSLDPITGAGNQSQLMRNLNKELNRAERESSVLSLIQINLESSNSRKHYNQLNKISNLIKEDLRPFDHYYFMSNNAFILLLPHCEADDAANHARHLSHAFKTQCDIPTTISCITQHLGETSNNLLNRLTESNINPHNAAVK
jgi:GGDEF domain-containing protein